MRDRINTALKEATKAQEKRRMSTLRLINAAIKDRDIAARGAGKDGVSDDDVLQILSKMIKQREESASMYEQAGRLDLCEQEREEIEIISDFLPRRMDDGEMESACRRVVTEIGAAGLRDMGKCMNTLKERYPGQLDFGKASKVVKDILAQ